MEFLKSQWKSFGYAVTGVLYVVRVEPHARIHIMVAALVVIAATVLDVSRADWAWLVISVGLVWAAEVVNTSIEYLCDVVHPEYSENIKHAKDIAAGSVLIVAVMAAIIGALVFFPYIAALI